MVRPRTDHLLDAHLRMAWRIERRTHTELVDLGDAPVSSPATRS